ncbi:MAG: ribonuclease D [Eggerthellaceae bacterium]|nr:ribonuclease D [Eggerthellaceae bacterium]
MISSSIGWHTSFDCRIHPIDAAITRYENVLITTQEEFEAFLKCVERSSILAIDTEFLRERTYYSKLCLLQMATPDEVALIDPFAVSDLSVMASVLQNPAVTKVFHAGSQDLEILYREVGVLPAPIFDTQVAATLLGYSLQVGYAVLVSSICGVTLKKADSYTDWSRRPLTDSQLQYAADDVLYLPTVYQTMVDELIEKGRLSWLDEDFARMSDPDHYVSNPYERYRKLKRVSHLSQRQLSAARELAAWREIEASKRNVPRKWVMTDEQVVEVCRREARTIDELFLIRGVRDSLSTRDARSVVSAIQKGLDASEEELPASDIDSHREANVDSALDLMEAIARVRSKEFGIAMQILAPHADLVKLARGYVDDCELMRGWRKSMLGDELVKLLSGELMLSLHDLELTISASSASDKAGE